MSRKLFTLAAILALLLATVFEAGAVGCTAGNPNGNVSEATPTSAFTDNLDGTVTHGLTGLMWKRCAQGQTWDGATCAGDATGMDWSTALVAAVAETTGGYGDWRLPNKKELQSLVEDCGWSPAINQTLFPATPASPFWSGSSYVPSPNSASGVSFGDGYTYPSDKTAARYVRLVRGGQAFDSFDAQSAAPHTVTYNDNTSSGGSAPVDDNSPYYSGSTVTVLGAGSLVKTNYTFSGWNTVADGSGSAYAAAATFAISADTTLFAQWTPLPTFQTGLPDTGQDTCYDGTGMGMVRCTPDNSGDASPYPRQNGRFGRDAAAAAGVLTKTGGGVKGFDYSKIANNGSVLDAVASLGSNPTDWACTKDNTTGLTWEVKTTSGLRSLDSRYTWYSSNGATNGGNAGKANGGSCSGGSGCDTEKFVADVNTTALCTYTDWRLPSVRELFTLVYYWIGNDNGGWYPNIDPTYFPNTYNWYYWSGSSYAPDVRDAWYVYFAAGDIGTSPKAAGGMPVRLVRGGQF